jgi:hypothetical protein
MTASDPKAGHCLYVYSYSAKDSASQGASSHSTVLTYDHLELIDFPLAAAVKINQCIISIQIYLYPIAIRPANISLINVVSLGTCPTQPNPSLHFPDGDPCP